MHHARARRPRDGRQDTGAIGASLNRQVAWVLLRDKRDRMTLDSLEGEGYAAADGAGGIDEIDCLAILAQDRNVSLSQQIADIDQGFHVATQSRDGLADEDVQERIALSGR